MALIHLSLHPLPDAKPLPTQFWVRIILPQVLSNLSRLWRPSQQLLSQLLASCYKQQFSNHCLKAEKPYSFPFSQALHIPVLFSYFYFISTPFDPFLYMTKDVDCHFSIISVASTHSAIISPVEAKIV